MELTKKNMLTMYVEKESGEGKEMKVCREGEVQGGGGVRVGKGRRDGGGTDYINPSLYRFIAGNFVSL